jgi:hypothetical protein
VKNKESKNPEQSVKSLVGHSDSFFKKVLQTGNKSIEDQLKS